MQQGRGGMGSHKHAVSGHFTPSPGYKMQRTRETNALQDAERRKRPRPEMFATVAEALANAKKR
jgi:hypothetical protein